VSTLNVGIVQLEPIRDAHDALNIVTAKAEEVAAQGAELIVFPEGVMHEFGLPDIDLAAIAQPLDGPWVSGLVDTAARLGVTLLAGMWEMTPNRDRARNTALAVNGDGIVARYQKAHLFDSFGFRESDFVEPGPAEGTIIELHGLRIGLTTCYDVRFPELYASLARDSVDAFCVIAGWVAGPGKVAHWETLLRARAIETTSYVIGVDLYGPRFAGHSGVWDPFGDQVASLGDGPAVTTAVLTTERVSEVRTLVPSRQHKRFDVAPAASN